VGLSFLRRWWWSTLLVIVACGVMIRLGIWQLERLDLRRQFNSRVQTQLDMPSLALGSDTLGDNLVDMEYRSVVVSGEYQFADEVALRNQVLENQPGIHLVTPLLIEGSSQAVLVDRGWIPTEDAAPERWTEYQQIGSVEVRGVIRRSSTRPDIGRRSDPIPAPGEDPLKVWNLLNVQGIAAQSAVSLLPVYIQQDAGPVQDGLPIPQVVELDLSEGPHLGYAGQWFLFAVILAVGYPFYVRRQEIARKSEKITRQPTGDFDRLNNIETQIRLHPPQPQNNEKLVHD
jgi:surfeit locus 1 family protein